MQEALKGTRCIGPLLHTLRDILTQMTKARGKGALGAEVNWTAMQVYLHLCLKQAERDQRDGKASPTRREFQKEAADLLGISRASMNRMAVEFNRAYVATGKVNDDAIRATKLRQGNAKPKKRLPWKTLWKTSC